jgi:hypothetical protein
MKWKVVLFEKTADGVERCTKLQDMFANAVIANQATEDAAMFGRSSRKRSEYECYFSPSAVSVFATTLSEWGADDADAPPKEEVSLLVGDAKAAWKLLVAP